MADNTAYQKLLEPGYIGSVKTRNRIIKSGPACSCGGRKTTSTCGRR